MRARIFPPPAALSDKKCPPFYSWGSGEEGGSSKLEAEEEEVEGFGGEEETSGFSGEEEEGRGRGCADPKG